MFADTRYLPPLDGCSNLADPAVSNFYLTNGARHQCEFVMLVTHREIFAWVRMLSQRLWHVPHFTATLFGAKPYVTRFDLHRAVDRGSSVDCVRLTQGASPVGFCCPGCREKLD